MSVPKHSDLFNPLLQTMKELGSSATIFELDEAVTKRLHLTDLDKLKELRLGVTVKMIVQVSVQAAFFKDI